MKLKHIIIVFALFISPLALVSCGDKGGSEGSGSEQESAMSHTEIGQGMVDVMSEMMNGMTEVKDLASAEAFAAKMPEVKTKMKDLHKAAKALPAPTEEEKAAVTKMMDDAEEKTGPAMMEAMMGMSNNPDAEAIGKIMGNVMEDEEMDKIGAELQALYQTEDSEEPETE